MSIGDLPPRRRTLLGGGLAAAGALGLAGCGGGVGGTGTTGPLSLLTYDDIDAAERLREQLQVFTQEQGTEVRLDTIPGSGAAQFPDKLRTRVLGGNAPDTWRIWGGMIGSPFVDAGLVLPLDDYYEQYRWEEFLAAPGVDGMTFSGHRSGVPRSIASIGAWCSAAILEEAGVDQDPTTYDELEQLNEAVLATGVHPAGMGGKFGWHMMRLFEYLLEVCAGPELHDALLLAEESWDRPEVVDAFALFSSWAQKEWIAPGALGVDPADAEMSFIQGTAAYTLSGTWMESGNIATSGQPSSAFRTFLLPTDHEVVRHSGFVEGYMISASSGRPDDVAALMDLLLRPEIQQALTITDSANTQARPDPQDFPFSAQWAQIRAESPLYTIQDQALPKAQSDSFYAIQSAVLQGSTAPQEAARDMQQMLSEWRSTR